MKKIKGSALVDYVVPTALVGVVVGIALFGLYQSGSLKNFIISSGNATQESDEKIVLKSTPINENSELIANKNYTSSNTASSSTNSDSNSEDSDSSTETGTSASTSSLSVECANNNCNLDFGGFVLTGIPEDFNEIIETSAASGGTETLASLIDQVAAAAENNSNVDSNLANLFKKLSNNGHSIASQQKAAENLASTNTSMNSSYEVESTINKYNSLLDSIDTTSFNTTLNQINSLPKSSNPTEETMITIVNTLAGEISAMNSSLVQTGKQSISAVQTSMDAYTKEMENNPNPVEPFSVMSAYSAIGNTKISTKTNIKSAIICSTGKGKDLGTECH